METYIRKRLIISKLRDLKMKSFEITENGVWIKNSKGKEVFLVQIELEHVLDMFKGKVLGVHTEHF